MIGWNWGFQNSPSWMSGGLQSFKRRADLNIWAREWGPKLRDAISAQAPVRTGRLRASIRYTTSNTMSGVRIEIHSNTGYAQAVAFGTSGGQEIAPVAARVLHWGGYPGTFSASVTRGATPANPFHQRGYASVRSAMTRSLAELYGSALAK